MNPITEKVNKLLENTPNPDINDPNREKKIFSYVYLQIINNVKYDYDAAGATVGYAREMGEKRVSEANGLEGGLLRGQALCRGYCEILCHLLSRFDIESKIISAARYLSKSGVPKDMHTWNQVKLDGKWYNADCTNDADFILNGLKAPYFLKSNDEFGENEYNRYKKYFYLQNRTTVHYCSESIDDKLQEELIEEQRGRINKENTNSNRTHTISDVINKYINKFSKKNKNDKGVRE